MTLMIIYVIAEIAMVIVTLTIVITDYDRTTKLERRVRKACKELEAQSDEIRRETEEFKESIRVSDSVLHYMDRGDEE